MNGTSLWMKHISVTAGFLTVSRFFEIRKDELNKNEHIWWHDAQLFTFIKMKSCDLLWSNMGLSPKRPAVTVHITFILQAGHYPEYLRLDACWGMCKWEKIHPKIDVAFQFLKSGKSAGTQKDRCSKGATLYRSYNPILTQFRFKNYFLHRKAQ